MEKGDKGSVEVSNLVRARLGSGQYYSVLAVHIPPRLHRQGVSRVRCVSA